MNKRIRLATGDKVRIIYRNSPYFGKIGEVIELRPVCIKMINSNGKPISSKTEYCCKVKLEDVEDTETIVEFPLSQPKKYDDC